METLRHKLIASLLVFCAVAIATAQNSERKEPIIASDNNCESNKALFDLIDISASDDGLIIVIARLGSGDNSRFYNQRRLHNISTYLNQWFGQNHAAITP